MLRLGIALLCCLGIAGCVFPSVRAKKNPAAHDTGIRYYRPKPYLLISALRSTKDNEGPATDEMVKVELQYLPDFSEEYSLCVTPGLGTANVAIKLDQGWNLTAIDQDLDSNVDDNIRAVGGLAADIGSAFVPTKGETSGTDGPSMVVRATNVPLGFYESVIGCTSTGQKQLFGWRYVGFAPFNACPTTIMGGTRVCCDAPDAAVYGLVFENGVMVFRPLHEIQLNGDTTRVSTDTETPGNDGRTKGGPEAAPATFQANATLDAIDRFVENHETLKQELGAFVVTVEPSWDQLNTIVVTVHAKPLGEPAQLRLRNMIVDDPALMELLRDVSPTAIIDLRFAVKAGNK